MCRHSSIPTYIFMGVMAVFYTSSLGLSTAKSSSLVRVVFMFRVKVHLTKYLTLPAIPLKVSYYFSKLGNLNLMVLLSVRIPAGYNSLEAEWN